MSSLPDFKHITKHIIIINTRWIKKETYGKKVTSIEISGKRNPIIKRKKIYDNQKKQTDEETAQILIRMLGHPVYHFRKELTSDDTLIYGPF